MSERLRTLTPLVALGSGLTAFCFLVSLSRLAFAQSPEPNGFAKTQLAGALLQALVPLAVAALTAILALVPKGFAWLSTHTKIARSAWADAVKERFFGVVEHFVLLELQTTVDTIKADYAAGMLKPADYAAALADVKQRVVANALDAASRQNLASDLQTVLGVHSFTELRQFASGAVEAVLARVKRPAVTP